MRTRPRGLCGPRTNAAAAAGLARPAGPRNALDAGAMRLWVLLFRQGPSHFPAGGDETHGHPLTAASKPACGSQAAIHATVAAAGPIRRVLGQNSPQDAKPVEDRFGGGYATGIGCFAVSRTAGLKSVCGVSVLLPFDGCPAGRPARKAGFSVSRLTNFPLSCLVVSCGGSIATDSKGTTWQ